MNIFKTIIFVTILVYAYCKDFYVGMFKPNDLLVAQDHLYKERVPYKYMYAKYGRIFKCKITYFKVSDRLGYRSSPKVQIVRGGLNHKYLVLRLTSKYNKPISVNIYVGCANTFKTAKVETLGNKTNNENITKRQTGDQEQNGVKNTPVEAISVIQTTGASGMVKVNTATDVATTA